LPPKGDVVDWQKAGHTREQLDALTERVPDWQPHQTHSGDRPQTRGLVAHRASEIIIEPVEWLWPGRIAIGKQTLMAGEAGLGKSQVSIAMAATVTTGDEWPCNEGCSPIGSVLFLCAEDGAADTIVPRLMAARAELNRVHIVSAVRAEDGKGHRAFNLQADLGLLEQKIGEIGDVRLIVVDPISSYMGPKVDSHVNAAVRGILEPVSELAARMRIAIVSITHPPKGTGTTAINRFIGSIAFVAAARSAFMVARDAEDESRRLFLPVKNNLAPLGNGLAFRLRQQIVGPPDKGIVASSVTWESNPVTISADEALRAADEGDTGHRAIDEATEFLRDKLSAGPVPVREVEDHARALGISKRTLERVRKMLNVQPVKTGFAQKGGWSLALP
jgi:RecA-family ATPase